MSKEVKGLAELQDALDGIGENHAEAIIDRMFADSGDLIVRSIINQARAGIGPGDEPYEPYSESYKTQLGLAERGGDFKRYKSVKRIKEARAKGKTNKAAKRAGFKAWLYSYNAPHMLHKDRFVLEFDGQSGIIGWNGADEQLNTYAKVHQGTEYGGEDYSGGSFRRGRVPPRPWLHLETSGSRRVYERAIDNAVRAIVADFNKGKK